MALPTKVPTAPPTGAAADWLAELRAPFLSASVVPVAVGAAVALWERGSLDWPLLALTLLGVSLLHLGANVTNDFWDFRRGTDVINQQRTPFSGGSPLLVEGRLRPRAVLRLGLVLLAAGAVVGLYLATTAGELWWAVVLMGAAGVGGGYFYTAPPFSLAARGVGELVIGSCFGVLAVAGTYLIQAHGVSTAALAASVPVSLWVAAIIWANQIPDAEADGLTGKRTLVVRIGRGPSVAVLAVMLGLAPGFIAAAALAGLLPAAAALGMVAAAPTAVALAAAARSHGVQPGFVRAQAWTILAQVTGGALLALGLAIASA
jgi:1,4-dihydroxy-2-naphthoate octaprenyltransferase